MQEAKDPEAEYVEEENLVNQGSIMETISALFAKRAHIYKRDKSGLVCEIVVPIVLVILGLAETKLTILSNSPVMALVPSAFPLKQRILLNENLIASDPGAVTTHDLYANLPNVDSSFEATYSTVTDWEQYAQEVFDQQFIGKERPNRYGSYLMY